MVGVGVVVVCSEFVVPHALILLRPLLQITLDLLGLLIGELLITATLAHNLGERLLLGDLFLFRHVCHYNRRKGDCQAFLSGPRDLLQRS